MKDPRLLSELLKSNKILQNIQIFRLLMPIFPMTLLPPAVQSNLFNRKRSYNPRNKVVANGI